MNSTISRNTVQPNKSVLSASAGAPVAKSATKAPSTLPDTLEIAGSKAPAGVTNKSGFLNRAKWVGGGLTASGILAFAGYGMFAAAPHIGALIGVIAASSVTVPVLGAVGAVLAIVGIVVVVRAMNKQVKVLRARKLLNDQKKVERDAAKLAERKLIRKQEQEQMDSTPLPAAFDTAPTVVGAPSSDTSNALTAERLASLDNSQTAQPDYSAQAASRVTGAEDYKSAMDGAAQYSELALGLAAEIRNLSANKA